jgi:hypothetical protein
MIQWLQCRHPPGMGWSVLAPSYGMSPYASHPSYKRDAKLTATFNAFQRRPALIAAHVVRFP